MAINLGSAIMYLNADPTELNRKLGQTKRNFNKNFGNIADMSRKVGQGFTIMGGAITAGMGLGAKAAADFSKGMGELNTLGVQNLADLETGIKDVAVEFGQELGPTAKATYDIISAGVSEGNALEVLAASAKAATAGVSDVATAAKLGTATLNAFGMEASQIDTVFGQVFVAVNKGVTTFGELAGAVGKVAPVMSAAGLESQEMFAAVAALTKGGLATTEAVTGLKAAMSNIIKPSSDAAKTAEALGLEFNVAALESQGLAGFLDSVKQATGGNIETMGKLFGSTEALNAVLALTGNQAGALTETLEAMGSAQTATDVAMQRFLDANPAFAFEQLKSAMSVLAVEVGQALLPSLIELARGIIPVVQGVVEWTRAHPGLTKAIVGVTAVVGGLMLVLGPILMVLPGLVAIWPAIAAAMAVVTAPALAVGAIIVGVVGLIVTYWDELKAAAVATWNFLAQGFDFLGGVFTGFGQAAVAVWDAIVGAIQRAADFIGGIIQRVVGMVQNAMSAVGDFLSFASGGLLGFGSGGLVPGFAAGGAIQSLAGGGMAKHRIVRVGEKGPELAALPVGSRVMSNSDMRGAVGGGGDTFNVNFGNVTVRNDGDIKRIAKAVSDEMGRMLDSASTRRGMRPGLAT